MNYKLDVMAGGHFDEVSKEAKKIAYENTFNPANEKIVEFDFNGIKCLVDWSTDLNLLYRDYSNAHLMGWESVGSKCMPIYSKKIKREMDKKLEAAAIESDKRAKEYNTKCANERAEFTLKTDGIEFDIINIKGWNKSVENNKDGYGNAVIVYAESWAKLMQLEISKGKSVDECSEHTSFELGYMGISGAQYGFAKSLLKQCWKYGNELK